MKVRKIRRKCMVQGCRNINTYALTASREFGHSVIICADCAKAAVEAIEMKEGNPSLSQQNRDTSPKERDLPSPSPVSDISRSTNADKTVKVRAKGGKKNE